MWFECRLKPDSKESMVKRNSPKLTRNQCIFSDAEFIQNISVSVRNGVCVCVNMCVCVHIIIHIINVCVEGYIYNIHASYFLHTH